MSPSGRPKGESLARDARGNPMSKAFTKESDEDEDLDLEPAESAPQVERNYITPAGLKRLRDEFAALWDVERPKLVETIAWAALNGDRSENADYIYGKRRLREIDRRIRFLSSAWKAQRWSTEAGSNDRVFFGATVTYRDGAGDERAGDHRRHRRGRPVARTRELDLADRERAAQVARGRYCEPAHAIGGGRTRGGRDPLRRSYDRPESVWPA